MTKIENSRREFLRTAALAAGGLMLAQRKTLLRAAGIAQAETAAPGYKIHIRDSVVEIAPKRFISTVTYNGQFPGPLLRFKEGEPVTVAIFNDTETPEQLHWHGQKVGTEVDGAAEEGTPFIPAHGQRIISFTPNPAGMRFYHTHNRAGENLAAGQYSGEVGPVYIEPKENPGRYDREIFLTLKEFEPTLSQGGDMAQDFLAGAKVKELEDSGEAAMKASLAKGKKHGFEVGYRSFTINGRMLGHGDPIRVKQGERVLLHVLNGSATEIRSLALPGHSFEVVALDGNPVPHPAKVPVLWLGTAERISAIVEMDHPGVWILGDLDNDDRRHGMGIVVEYTERTGKPAWIAPPASKWDYTRFAKADAGAAATPDQTIEMTFVKDNAAEDGFNRWTINGDAYPMMQGAIPAAFHVKQGKRYRIRMRNGSDDIHPIHLHRHSFELTKIAGKATAGILKDVVMLGGYQEAEVDFVADNPGLTLFHCHQQLHMDFGFMTLIDYVSS
ncbi:MAG TPA: multicopper oxidase domain-containing protein [Candidatus Acidoferrum sp.]